MRKNRVGLQRAVSVSVYRAELLERRQLLSYSGVVYNDANANKTLDSGEVGLPGRTVFVDLNNNGVLDTGEPSTTTNSSGQFTLTTSSVGTLTAVLPTGWYTTGTTLIQGAGTSSYDLGQSQGMIASGVLYDDVNSNGNLDTGDTRLAGVVVYEDLNNNGVYDAGEPKTLSASDGSYALTIQPESYYAPSITFSAVSEYVSELPETAFGYTQGSTISISSGYSPQSYVEAYVDQYEGSNGYASFYGATIYADVNNDGVLDAGDVSATATYGYVQFGNLPQGNVAIRMVLPSGYSFYDGTGVSQITVGTLTSARVFFYIQQNTSSQTISGTVYTDVNGNGAIDSGDTVLSGATVYVDTNDNGVLDSGELSTTTDANGQYQLTETSLGTYLVRVVLPTGDVQTVPSSGAGYTVALTTANQAVTGENFAVTPGTTGGTVSGSVFTDYYGNGSTTPLSYEPGVAGATVFADLNGNGILDANEPSTVTNLLGNYSLANLPSGNLNLRVVPPANYVSTDVGGGKQVVSAPSTNVDFPIFQYMEFKGVAYVDSNGNEELDTNESPQAGFRVYIDSNDNGVDDPGEPTSVTGANGVFDLKNIAPIYGSTSYLVRVVTLPGYISQIVSYSVGYFSGDVNSNSVAQDSESFVQGYVEQQSNGSSAPLAGQTVFADLNNDGILDSGDISAVTGVNGGYRLGNMPYGAYNIDLILPTGFSISQGSASQLISVGTLTRPFAAFYVTTDGQPYGSIGGTVFQDTNSNGIDDLTEYPIAGRTVYIDTNDNGVLDAGEPTSVTDSAGQFLFTGLSAGIYYVRQVLPAGSTQTTPVSTNKVTISSYNGLTYGQSLSLGSYSSGGSASGNVFLDTNFNGVQDIGESDVAGQEVYIDSNDNGVYDVGEPLAISTASGFTFSNVTPGSYVVRQILSAGYQQTSPASGAGVGVTVVAGQTASANFGIDNPTPTANIQGVSMVAEGSSISLSGAGSTELGGQIVKYEWDLDYDGVNFIAGVTGNSAVFSAATLDGPSTELVALRVTDAAGNTNINSEYITITNVAPTAAFSGSTINQGSAGTVSFTNAYDPSSADTAAGFTYSYDFNDDGTYDLVTNSATATVPAIDLTTTGSHTIAGKITDKDGGDTTYTATVQVNAVGPIKLPGTVIGTTGSYLNDGNTAAKAFDGDLTTYFDAPTNSGSWIGLDLGSAKVITSLAYASRSGWASRMNGGIFQASNSSTFASGVVNLYTIGAKANPSSTALTYQTVTNTTAYRYVRYLPPANSFGNVAEVQFFGNAPVILSKFTGTTIGTSGSYQSKGNTIAKATDGNLTTFFDGPTANGNWVGLDLGTGKIVKQISFAPRSGYTSRMVGGIFQASNSATFSTGVVNLYTVSSAPTAGVLTSVTVNVTTAYRYYRYLSPNGSEGDIAEVGFYG